MISSSKKQIAAEDGGVPGNSMLLRRWI